MKNLKLTTLLLALFMVFGSTSCKYEEGPGISLRTKKARITGEWNIEKYIDENGNEENETDSPVIEFKKDGDGVVSFTDGGTTHTFDFNWEFSDNKEDLKITFDGESNTEEILRLTNKELWTKDSDGVQTHYKAL